MARTALSTEAPPASTSDSSSPATQRSGPRCATLSASGIYGAVDAPCSPEEIRQVLATCTVEEICTLIATGYLDPDMVEFAMHSQILLAAQEKEGLQ